MLPPIIWLIIWWSHGSFGVQATYDDRFRYYANIFVICSLASILIFSFWTEYSTTESSDDVGKQDIVELSDEDEPCFFDTRESFTERSTENANKRCTFGDHMADDEMVDFEPELSNDHSFPHVQRRKKLPDPTEKEKCVSLWSVIKDNVGKDLTRVCLPVYFNEPLSSLQKCCEDLEYSYLLDRAYDYGKMVGLYSSAHISLLNLMWNRRFI